MDQQILDFLQGASTPQATIAIARAVGCTHASQVNPTLYKLRMRSLIDRTEGRAPVWHLAASK